MDKNIRLRKLSECMVFFDFDNTITSFDVLDAIIERYAVDDKWVAFEKLWKEGRIGSRECLQGQLPSVRVTKQELSRYLSKIKLASYFCELIAMLKREGIRPVILSDSFSFIINSILRNNGIKGIKVYSNALRFYKDRIVPSFPYTNKRCKRCAHCKKKILLKHEVRDKIILYIGDGLSDICPAQYADIPFAKGQLLEYFRKKKKLCVAFKDFKDIYEYLGRLER